MDLSKAFDTIDRTLLWATLYRRGLPGEMIRPIGRGHQGQRLAPKYRGRYGEAEDNNIGVFQGSAISELICIIYLDDMMEDLASLNRRTDLPMRVIQDRPREQKKKLPGADIKNKEEDIYDEIQRTRTIRNDATENDKWETRKEDKSGEKTQTITRTAKKRRGTKNSPAK